MGEEIKYDEKQVSQLLDKFKNSSCMISSKAFFSFTPEKSFSSVMFKTMNYMESIASMTRDYGSLSHNLSESIKSAGNKIVVDDTNNSRIIREIK